MISAMQIRQMGHWKVHAYVDNLQRKLFHGLPEDYQPGKVQNPLHSLQAGPPQGLEG